ncbi:short-chain dehydrogenase [Rhodococcus sp. RS1C4]|nr:SDR family NAD(P)-dependent oxidoreductase [Rhodococcus sp. RS1C4]OZC57138.1 short-chain dehydrogenase [Rhodococcus sp. RS1C4]
MSRILITGSSDGIGRACAVSLLDDGHEVIVHARSQQRLSAVEDLISRGAASVVGDLSLPEDLAQIAEQANRIGAIQAVVHNAGIIDGPLLLPVNVVAPYVLTATIHGPGRLIYLSSSMHRGGHADLSCADWSGSRKTVSYSDSKLFATTLMAAVARLAPASIAHAVDPGWVPTKMGGPDATGVLSLSHVTQSWLATTDDSQALVSGRYWHHHRTEAPHCAVHDEQFQADLLLALEKHTGVQLSSN